MSALDPVSCCLASTARGHPIQVRHGPNTGNVWR